MFHSGSITFYLCTIDIGNPFAVTSDEYFAAEGQVPAA